MEKHQAGAIRGHETILIVDDDKDILNTTGMLLEKVGYSVLIAPSGTQALDIYKSNHGSIDLVILPNVE